MPHPKNTAREAAILASAKLGGTLSEIASRAGTTHAIVWRTLNRERQNENARESGARWHARGGIALCDMKD